VGVTVCNTFGMYGGWQWLDGVDGGVFLRIAEWNQSGGRDELILMAG